MSTFFIIILSIALILISLFSVLIILMQRPSEDAGMGSALGGGAVTSIFGGEAGNVLHRWTIASTILFFIISFILSLLYMAREGKKEVVMDLITSPRILATSSSAQEKTNTEAENSNNPKEQPGSAEVEILSEEDGAPDASIASLLKKMESTTDISDEMTLENNPEYSVTSGPSELLSDLDKTFLSQEEGEVSEEKISEEKKWIPEEEKDGEILEEEVELNPEEIGESQ